MAETRKLAAILAADVVGYSRLAGADEDRTLARLRALRSDLIDPTIAVHNGRVVKRTGDGALVEFRSVVDAVRCAIEVQNGMVERNAGLPPERRIEFRIGIHLGDVVEESDGDLMGDGVNIAARLEGIAKPGSVYLSEDAYRQVKARLDLAVSDLGDTQLKNIAEPIPGLLSGGRRSHPSEACCVINTKYGTVFGTQPLDCCAALHQFGRGPRAGILRRWRHREPDDRSFAHRQFVRDSPQHRVLIQGQIARCTADRARVECPLRARRFDAAWRKSAAGERAVDRHRNGKSPMGRALRQARCRPLRYAR